MKIENCEIELSVARAPAPQELEMVLWPREELNELQRPRPDKLLFHIANVVNHGGLSGARNPPIAAALEVESQPATGVLKRRLRVRGIDPGAWRVVLGSCLSAAVRGFPLQRLEIASPNEIPGALGAREAFTIPYPEAPEQLPFQLERSVVGSSRKDRLIRISFQRPPQDEVVQALTSALLSWDELLWGGYPIEGQSPMENATDASEAYLIDPLTVEHPLPNYLGSDAAFDAVICMALWFHERGERIAQVNLW